MATWSTTILPAPGCSFELSAQRRRPHESMAARAVNPAEKLDLSENPELPGDYCWRGAATTYGYGSVVQ